MKRNMNADGFRSFRPQAFALAVSLAVLLAGGPAPAQKALRRRPDVPPPVVVPYAADRHLLPTDSLLLDWTDAARNDRDVPLKIYFPGEGDGPFPVIVFSHGLGGTRQGYEYLGRQWAAHGYVCVHAQHAGSDDAAWRGQSRRMQSMKRAISAQNTVDRAKDIHFILDRLDDLNQNDPQLKGKLDLSHIGVAGHSFGANTALLVAGQQLGASRLFPSFADDRVKAIIPMSPPVPARHDNLDECFAAVKVPVFVMTGTRDDSPIADTTAADRRLVFDHLTAAPLALLLTFNGGDHLIFSGRLVRNESDANFQEQIRLCSTAFWDACLKNDSAARSWLLEGDFQQELGDRGTFEQR